MTEHTLSQTHGAKEQLSLQSAVNMVRHSRIHTITSQTQIYTIHIPRGAAKGLLSYSEQNLESHLFFVLLLAAIIYKEEGEKAGVPRENPRRRALYKQVSHTRDQNPNLDRDSNPDLQHWW